ncbi:uncharacterized protein [Battus philenor]|uniref:uncharacterized protein n=1 Tax=Battus philenor TaxID=42288 RepID=UPI0035CFA88D
MQVEIDKCCDIKTTKIIYSNNEQLPYHLQRALKKIAKEEGYVSYDITSREISTAGGNYMALLYEADIKGETRVGRKETNLFIKCAITAEKLKIIDITDLYTKELFYYTDLSKVYNDLEEQAAVPLEERYKSVKSYNGSTNEAIILENLTKDDFTTIYRMNVMPLKFAELSVQQLAKFHSLNMVIELKMPEYFERNLKNLKYSIEFNDTFASMLHKFYECSASMLDCETRNKLDKQLPEHIENYQRYLAGDKTEVKCLCHGDYRMNNILMKMKDNIVTEVIPVDYQLMFYGSPIIDFLYFIYGGTDKEFRSKYMNHLKEMYFKTMEGYLRYFNVDINAVYPRKTFDKDYENCLEYGFQVTLFFGPINFTDENEIPDFHNNSVEELNINANYLFEGRLRGAIDEMIELGKL